MQDPEKRSTHTNTHVERTTERSGGSGPLIFIVGGLVVAVGVLAWVLLGGDMEMAGNGGGGNVDVTVESSETTETSPPADESADAGATTGAEADTTTN